MRYGYLAVVLALALPGCSVSKELPALQLSPAASVYRLGTGDVLKVTVYGEERLTGSYPVNGEGRLAFPLLGELPASGKTLKEVEELIRTGLGEGFVNNPSVTVEVANYRPFYILGEVNRPGEYPYSDGLSVFAAVAKAGGFTYRASQKRIYIRHKESGDENEYRLDGSTPVQPGDTIRVDERSF